MQGCPECPLKYFLAGISGLNAMPVSQTTSFSCSCNVLNAKREYRDEWMRKRPLLRTVFVLNSLQFTVTPPSISWRKATDLEGVKVKREGYGKGEETRWPESRC